MEGIFFAHRAKRRGRKRGKEISLRSHPKLHRASREKEVDRFILWSTFSIYRYKMMSMQAVTADKPVFSFSLLALRDKATLFLLVF